MNRLIDCVDIFIMTILKHMINVFVILGVIGFVYVISIISTDDTPDRIDPYEIRLARESSEIASLV